MNWMKEAELASAYRKEIDPFWRQGREGTLVADDGLGLHYRLFEPAGAETLVVISAGRTESVIKYQELIFELGRRGLAVAVLDHRGQGLSGRESHDGNHGHVRSFDHYVTDFRLFMEQVVKPLGYRRHWLLAHSMGGCIAALYLARHSHPFERCVMSAPMFAIHTHPFPRWLAKAMTRLQSRHHQRLGRPGYVITGKAYARLPFEDNRLTHSRVRFEHYQDWYEEYTEAQLGAPTAHWLDAAFGAMAEAIALAPKIGIPVLVLIAGEDRIVARDGQDAFLAGLQDGQGRIIEGAWHELLVEADAYRDQALSLAWSFLNEA
ncbi:alpha/beta fold hydrolase [Gallaecimonas sp. GXIMD4217]|uniref:alpha/beta fold hydrolase n=1 Tax=Gallaecimonas sp. GXIMD4217 TaxID=3131927 RepID=UPI00311AC5FC